MKSFDSFISDELENYLNYRSTLGFKNKSLRSGLRKFDRYLYKTGSTYENFTPLFFLQYRKVLKGNPKTSNQLLSAVRGFFDYLVRKESITENPLQDIPSFKENAYIPFIFSPEEADVVLQTVLEQVRHNEKYFFNDMMIYTVILLLARCGLRISEPLGLPLNNYRQDEGSIYIEKTKFYKDRLIPVPKETLNELNNYLSLRKTFFQNDDNLFLFPGKGCKCISKNRIYPVFNRAVMNAGLKQQRKTIDTMSFGASTPHSLRHSFAVNTLKKIKKQGGSPQQALPILSAYMGHSKYRYTAVYLKVIDAKHRRHLIDFSLSKQKDL
ncbi:tyrosine-type recombinase/integrase [Candidatus Pacearchaeota archaeon]|nr:tyrosine-type recombinase/integrase [Candidatus Pacearchaeota archaeon]